MQKYEQKEHDAKIEFEQLEQLIQSMKLKRLKPSVEDKILYKELSENHAQAKFESTVAEMMIDDFYTARRNHQSYTVAAHFALNNRKWMWDGHYRGFSDDFLIDAKIFFNVNRSFLRNGNPTE